MMFSEALLCGEMKMEIKTPGIYKMRNGGEARVAYVTGDGCGGFIYDAARNVWFPMQWTEAGVNFGANRDLDLATQILVWPRVKDLELARGRNWNDT